jgi:23S rRNA pseudouridine2457 synthase
LAIKNLEEGVIFKDYKTKKAVVKKIAEPKLWERSKPIRFRRNIPTSWIDIQIAEGKNRQVRKMTAHVGFPTLRIVRYKIDIFELNNLKPGQYEIIK